ncbi:MAG: glycosyltransferase, partial [Candidatus Andersenbacteria bacterium]
MVQAPWIVIPTYNESNNIARLCQELLRLNVAGLQVLIVDDNSPDGTGTVVRDVQRSEPAIHLLTRPGKEGLGRAYVAGFRYAIDHGAAAIVQMDADFSHDPADIPRLLKHLETADLVLGSRYTNGISVINWPLRRLLVSLGGNMYARLVTGMPFRDVTGGFKAWR